MGTTLSRSVPASHESPRQLPSCCVVVRRGFGGPGPIEVQILDTVLGLSVTPNALGWVLAEGHGADGTIRDHRELELRSDGGLPAVSTAEQVADEVIRVNALAAESGQHLRVIGVTWNDDASAQAALLLESLTDAGFDNVVPVRWLEAVETLARAIAPVIGFEQTAVCILERDSSTIVMVDAHDDGAQTAIKRVSGGFDGLTSWLTGMFDRDGWRPAGVVVAGSDTDITALSWQLEKALPVPVFAQTMAQVTVARGAALAAARSTEFTDEQLVARVDVPVVAPGRPRQLSYAGAVTALAVGAITFVASLSLAVGLQLAPKEAGTTKHVVHSPTPEVAEAVAPAVVSPPKAETPAPESMTPAPVPSSEPVTDSGAPDPNGPQPYLTRVLDHIPADYGDATPPPAPPQP
jgi:hypothetical protein